MLRFYGLDRSALLVSYLKIIRRVAIRTRRRGSRSKDIIHPEYNTVSRRAAEKGRLNRAIEFPFRERNLGEQLS